MSETEPKDDVTPPEEQPTPVGEGLAPSRAPTDEPTPAAGEAPSTPVGEGLAPSRAPTDEPTPAADEAPSTPVGEGLAPSRAPTDEPTPAPDETLTAPEPPKRTGPTITIKPRGGAAKPAAEPKAAEPKTAEPKPAEPKPAEPTAAEPKAAEPKTEPEPAKTEDDEHGHGGFHGHHIPAGEEPWWHDHPANVKKMLVVFWSLCAIVLAIDLLQFTPLYSKADAHFTPEWVPGFYGFYGFAACVVLVLLAKQLRKLVMRPEDYYDG